MLPNNSQPRDYVRHFPIPDALVAQSRNQSAQMSEDAFELMVCAHVPCKLIVAVALKPHFIEMDRDKFIESLRLENAGATVEHMNSNPSLGTRELDSKFARTRTSLSQQEESKESNETNAP